MNTTFDNILVHTKEPSDFRTNFVKDLVYAYGGIQGIEVSVCRDLIPNKITGKTLLVSIGGDGTMLSAMRISTNFDNIIVLGLNTGTLGFLSEEVPHRLDQLLDNILFDKNGFLEERMVLSGSYFNGSEEITNIAVNEFVITGKSINAPVVTEVFINEQFVSKQLGNGVLVSTSTGSTAMSLSAGGAIVSPSTNIMQIVPLVAHTLTSRPIITTGRDVIKIRTTLSDRVPEIEIHADGQTIASFNQDDDGDQIEFTIKKYGATVQIWRPEGWNFFNVLTEKMKW